MMLHTNHIKSEFVNLLYLSFLADPLQHLSASVDVHWSSHGLHGLCLSLLCIPRMFRVYWSVHGKIIQPFFPLFPPPVPFSLLVKCECCVCTTHEYVSDEKIVRFFSCCMLNPSLSLLLVSFTREKESVKHRTRIMVRSCRVNPFLSPVLLQKSIWDIRRCHHFNSTWLIPMANTRKR